MIPRLPDPALVVLAGAAGSGKSHWAAQRFRTAEIVSSDALRAVVGSGPADLDATGDAFELLDRIVTARAGRGLATVVDTLGLDPDRRRDYLRLARAAGLPAVLVILDTPAALTRQRNRERDRPVPATVVTEQLRRVRRLVEEADDEGWDLVVVQSTSLPEPVDGREVGPSTSSGHKTTSSGHKTTSSGHKTTSSGHKTTGSEPETTGSGHGSIDVILQVSRFPWPEADPTGWLVDLALAAEAYGFAGLALMDHLIQIPQVDRAWEPIPEPWVTLGLLAGLDTRLRLGTLVSPVTFRAPGIIAKAAATLDVLSGGRAFCGLGAGWWLREHQAYGLDFPSAKERLDALQVCLETMRALWAPGTKAYAGRYVHLPETTCYPRPVGPLPILVGGGGEQRTLRIVAEQADGCNVASDLATLPRKLAVLRRHCADLGRDPDDVEVTVLDVPVVGRDREDVATRVERLRGRTPAPVFAARHSAGRATDHAERYRTLADLGVRTVFLALPDLAGADDLERCAPLLAALR